jgi:hypothetical protein
MGQASRFLASRSDSSGLSRAEAFGNSFEDAVSLRFPPRLSVDGSSPLRQSQRES